MCSSQPAARPMRVRRPRVCVMLRSPSIRISSGDHSGAGAPLAAVRPRIPVFHAGLDSAEHIGIVALAALQTSYQELALLELTACALQRCAQLVRLPSDH